MVWMFEYLAKPTLALLDMLLGELLPDTTAKKLKEKRLEKGCTIKKRNFEKNPHVLQNCYVLFSFSAFSRNMRRLWMLMEFAEIILAELILDFLRLLSEELYLISMLRKQREKTREVVLHLNKRKIWGKISCSDNTAAHASNLFFTQEDKNTLNAKWACRSIKCPSWKLLRELLPYTIAKN
jgi:hypothetical protein